MYEQANEIMQVVYNWVAKQQATLNLTTETAERTACAIDLTVLPLYQQRNWLLAYYVYKYLENRGTLLHLTRQVLQQTLHTRIPGRMDTVRVRAKTIIMDGAHNEQKTAAFITSFRQLYPGVKPAIMIALKQGKEYQAVAPQLATLAARVFVTTFNTSQDLPARSIDPQVLAKVFRRQAGLQVESMADQHIAFQALLAAPETVCIITGSFYLLSQLRKNERILAEA